MLARLFLLFLIVPVADLLLLLWLAKWLTFWPTVILVLSTATIGAWMARWQLRKLHCRAADPVSGPSYVPALFGDTILIFLAGALLITPGLITDTVGFLLLIPRIRAWLRSHFAKWFLGNTQIQFMGMGSSHDFFDATTVDGTVNREAENQTTWQRTDRSETEIAADYRFDGAPTKRLTFQPNND